MSNLEKLILFLILDLQDITESAQYPVTYFYIGKDLVLEK